jgi:hypothetical protein
VIAEGDAVRIRTVRVAGRYPGAELPSGIGGALGGADLRPRGLPRSAIVCLRRVRAPRPWSAHREGRDVRMKLEWEQGARGALEAAVERAARPARGAVPVGAEAVYFADRAELLACLASDWCDGSLSGRWWWRALFRTSDVGGLPLRAWLDAPEHAPPALARLAAGGRSVPFARRLRPAEALTLLRAVLRRHRLDRLEEAIEASRLAGERRVEATAPAPWNAWSPARGPAELAPEQEALLGILLTLHRSPSVARSRPFAEAVRRWHAAIARGRQRTPEMPSESGDIGAISGSAGPRLAPRPVSPALHAPMTEGSESEGAGRAPEVAAVEAAESGAPDAVERRSAAGGATSSGSVVPGADGSADAPATVRGSGSSSGDRPGPDGERASTSWPSADDRPGGSATVRRYGLERRRRRGAREPTAHETAGRRPDAALTGQSADWPIPSRHAPARQERGTWSEGDGGDGAASDRAPAERQIVETAFGGLLYLVNVGLFLELYGDFTQPRRRGIDLPIWDFVALLGERLAGRRLRRDPIWPLLARLAGRSVDDPPGRGFRPPASWRLPPDWLGAFPEPGTWRWSADGRRRRVAHPAGFLVLDLPVSGADHAARLRRALRPYGGHSFILRPARRALPGPAAEATRPESWIGWLLPYVRARLRRALGLSRAGQLPGVLLRHRARLVLTATELEVVLSLGNLPIEVRLAGLDRDPGWVPAAGRFVAFRFE